MEGHVRKRGDKWYYSFEAASIDGKRKRVERVGGRTKKEAEVALRKALEEYTGTGKHMDLSEQSFSDYLDYYLDNYVKNNCRPNTIRFYKSTINNHIKPAFGHLLLKALTPAIIDDGYNRLKLSGVAKGLMDGICTITSAALKKAVYPYQLIKDNPAAYVERPRYDGEIETQTSIVRPEEFQKIIDKFPYGKTPYLPLLISYHTGMRIGEILALTWDDIDLKNRKIVVRHQIAKTEGGFNFTPTKTKTSVRTIDFGNTLFNILNHHRKAQKENQLRYAGYYHVYYASEKTIYPATKADSGTMYESPVEFVCTKDNGLLTSYGAVAQYNKKISKILERPFTFHDLRHSHATLALENGAELKAVSERLGHAKLAITADVYIEATKAMTQKAVEAFESSLCLPEKNSVGKS